jgi:hypothetical protein
MIEVKIEAHEVARATNDIHIGTRALERLRAAGVPVKGNLFPIGVERGRLTVYEDLFGDTVYEWVED